MRMRRVMLGALVLAVVLIGSRGYKLAEINLAHSAALKGHAAGGKLQTANDQTWDDGWRILCNTDRAAVRDQHSQPATLRGIIQAEIDQGQYDTALVALDQAAAEGWIDQVANVAAYRAALKRQWDEAVRLYQPEKTPRQSRWWGTIFYLAAQQRWFDGDAGGAAPLYRQADALYGTQGPYVGLGLVNCLKQDGRILEAFDALRRALVALPAREALTHWAEFVALRVDALQEWQTRDPTNAQAAQWRAFYQVADETDQMEMLTEVPRPRVTLAADLSGGRKLLGFDYRREDIETGPFMTVDFYTQVGERVMRERRTVLNQAPNGSFTWDGAPDAVRPFGWPTFVYSPDLRAVYRAQHMDRPWLCVDAGRIGTSFGLQSLPTQLTAESQPFVQGGQVWATDPASKFSLGRRWSGTTDEHPYTYTSVSAVADQVNGMAGLWEAAPQATDVVIWMMAHQTSKACFRELWLFMLPSQVR